MLVELEVKGSGAATLDSFYGYDEAMTYGEYRTKDIRFHTSCRP
jgi:hypothetical protein